LCASTRVGTISRMMLGSRYVCVAMLLAAGCAMAVRGMSGPSGPSGPRRPAHAAAVTAYGQEAAQNYDAARSVTNNRYAPAGDIAGGKRSAEQCSRSLGTLTSSGLYDPDTETLPTADGPKTLNALNKACAELAVALDTRLREASRPHETTAEDLRKYVAEQTDGHVATVQVHGQLDAVESWDIPVKRGVCYVVVWQVDAGAALGEAARSGVEALVEVPGEKAYSDNALHGPGGVIDLLCPHSAGTARVLLGVAGRRPTEVGHGGYTMQVYEKSISEKVVRELEKQEAEAKSFGERRNRDVCDHCERERDGCLSAGKKWCRNDYETCLQVAGVRREACH
jgi:hypothetical protein